MRHVRIASITLFAISVAALSGCPTDPAVDGGLDVPMADVPMADGGRDGGRDVGTDGGNPCMGLTLCPTAGTSCMGDTLVTCAANPMGCLVETRTDCTASGGSCDDTGTAMCTADPCAGVPMANRCTTAGTTCDADELVVCAANPMGCLVQTRTDCAASPGGVCDDGPATPVCALPPDPCASIPMGDRCTTAGTSCTGNNLTTCAPNAFGCLVNTVTACDSRAGGTCNAAAMPAACEFTSDPCAGVTECAAAGTACVGPELVTCAADAFGCLVETTVDCTDTTFGFCDAATTPDRCSTAAVDPCMGVTECTPAGRACDTDGTTLRTCAPNAFGCLVETTTDCAAGGDVCGLQGGMAVCDNVCSFRTTCPAAAYCDMASSVTCAPDADGCLVESARTTCPVLCTASTGLCSAACPGASPTIIDCTSGTVMGDTTGGSTAITAYAPCTTSINYAGAERVFIFRGGAVEQEVTIASTSMSTNDYDLFALDGGDGSAVCGAPGTCLDASRGGSANESVTFASAPGSLQYIVYDLFGTGMPATFNLAVSCVPVVCGDGVINGAETCDDTNTTAGDGCSATCRTEPLFACTGTPSVCTSTCPNGVVNATAGETCDDNNMTAGDGCSPMCATEMGFRCFGAPSTCVMTGPNATCGGAVTLAAGTPLTGQSIASGGATPTGTGCGFSSGPTLYYSVTIPALSTGTVQATAVTGFNAVVRALTDCAATSCAGLADVGGTGASETLVLTNTGTAAVTRVVAVSATAAAASGTFSLALATAALPFEPIPGMCVDMTGATALTFASTDDSASANAALPFAFTFFGVAQNNYTVTTNGFMQLFPGAGTGSTAFTNATIPTAATPNNYIAPYWDDLSIEPMATFGASFLTVGTAPSRRFVVQWRVNDFTPTNVFRFQAHLVEGSNVVELHYCELPTGSTGGGATIGIEDATGAAGRLVGFNAAGTASTATGFRFTP